MGCMRRAGNQQELEPREFPVLFIAVQPPVVDDSLWPSWIAIHDAESLLPGGRGVETLNNETTVARVR